MSNERKYTDEQSKEILTCIANTLVAARLIQHLCWETQPDMIKLCKMLGKDEVKILELEQSIYNKSRSLADSLNATYNGLPKYMGKDGVKTFYLNEIYDNLSCLEGVDEVLSELSLDVLDKIMNDTLKDDK